MDDQALELVRGFVNTLDVETGTDELATTGGAEAWLRAADLLTGDDGVSAAKRHRLVAVREALRAHLRANNGESLPPEAVAVLDRQATRSRVGLRFGQDGAILESAAPDVDGALGRLLAHVARAMAAGTWRSLKACRADDCRWAFVDSSRNHSRHWCSMEVCGNRQKARAFRARARGAR
jgi:predicted RNA-binding Zn ribbon-like protein